MIAHAMLLRRAAPCVIGTLVLAGLYWASLHNYLFFHYLAESFSILVSFSIFMFAWNTRTFVSNRYLMLLGTAYLFVGGFDLLHTLAYKGMGVFGSDSANLATQLWIVARYLECLSLLMLPLLLNRKITTTAIILPYAGVSTVLVMALFPLQLFPDCFIDGIGLTPFKKISEYVICGILVTSAILLHHHRPALTKAVYHLLMASIGFTIAAELAFTLYLSVYGITNFFGHIFKIISFYFVYRAIVVNGLLSPYQTLFSELAEKKTALETYSRELELRVDNRAQALESANHKLMALSNAVLSAEEAERKRIARDLHDSIGQSLSTIKVHVENIITVMTGRMDDAQMDAMEKLVPMTLAAIHEVRRIVMDLRPSILDDLGIVATIHWACREFNGVYGEVAVEKTLELTEDQVPQEIKTAIYRILQEGLNNVAKHSGADCVSVFLGRRSGQIVFEVTDNGCGFDPNRIPRSTEIRQGFGLTGMRERLELAGAEFTLATQPGNGTIIRAAWPLAA